MNFIQRIVQAASRNFFSTTVYLWNQGYPLPSRFNTAAMVREAYEENSLCYASAMEIATSMAEAPLKARQNPSGKELSTDNPLAMLLQSPNDYQSMPELIIETTIHLLTSGNAYWLMDDPRFPTFFQTLPSNYDQVRPMFKDGKLYYVFLNWGGKEQIYPAEQILHFKEAPDLNDPLLRGMPPIVPIRRHVRIHNILSRYVEDFFSNNAVPPAMLIFKDKLPAQEIKRITEEMKEKHATPGKYHSLGISFGDAKIEKLGLSIKDLDLEPVLAFVETAILQAFNIPPILVGAATAMKVSGWGSNYQEARRSFQAENLSPRQRLMEQVLNRGLASKFGARYEIFFDQSDVLALQDDRAKKKDQATAAWNAGAMTLDEWRADYGLAPLGNDEGKLRKPQNTGGAGTFNPIDQNPPQDNQPPQKALPPTNGKAADTAIPDQGLATAS